MTATQQKTATINKIAVKLGLSHSQLVKVVVSDMMGQVFSEQLCLPTDDELNLDVSRLPIQCYLIEIYAENWYGARMLDLSDIYYETPILEQ